MLNRPQVLNALTLDMIRALDARLRAWAGDPSVRTVVVEGAGARGFCAGGDVRAMYDVRGTESDLPAVLYREEYSLNYRIHRLAKPYVALMDGITMGGGVGVSVHGSHRVATERTLFAMPETGIGLFPDVGGSYFLPRLPGQIGLYLALTGARLGAADCRYAGIATHCLPSARLDDLKAALATADPSGDAHAAVDAVLAGLDEDPGEAPLARHRAAIDRCFAGRSVDEVIAALAAEGTDWAAAQRDILATKSPTSLKITFRQIRAGRRLDFAAAMTMEYRMVQRCMAGHDFYEGVRAVVIDKDQRPRWRPARLEAVSAADVDAYFAPLGAHDLVLD
jgi:enoyl-CoA hydratase